MVTGNTTHFLDTHTHIHNSGNTQSWGGKTMNLPSHPFRSPSSWHIALSSWSPERRHQHAFGEVQHLRPMLSIVLQPDKGLQTCNFSHSLSRLSNISWYQNHHGNGRTNKNKHKQYNKHTEKKRINISTIPLKMIDNMTPCPGAPALLVPSLRRPWRTGRVGPQLSMGVGPGSVSAASAARQPQARPWKRANFTTCRAGISPSSPKMWIYIALLGVLGSPKNITKNKLGQNSVIQWISHGKLEESCSANQGWWCPFFGCMFVGFLDINH